MFKKPLVGAAGVHFVAAELSRRGQIALATVRNTEGIDLVVQNPVSQKIIGVQVKTRLGKPTDDFLRVSYNILNTTPNDIFQGNSLNRKVKCPHVFVYLPHDNKPPRYFVVPTKDTIRLTRTSTKYWFRVTKHKKPVATLMDSTGPQGPIVRFLRKYENRWDLLHRTSQMRALGETIIKRTRNPKTTLFQGETKIRHEAF